LSPKSLASHNCCFPVTTGSLLSILLSVISSKQRNTWPRATRAGKELATTRTRSSCCHSSVEGTANQEAISMEAIKMDQQESPGILEVGTPAPNFRLASAQGGEIALEDYRGQRHVILWFSRGLYCPFCRRYMSQLG